MKKFMCLVLFGILCCSLLGCGSDESNNKDMPSAISENTRREIASDESNDKDMTSAISETTRKEISSNESSNKDMASENVVNYVDCFGGIDGCAVFYAPSENEYNFYNKDYCNEEVTPCSTFKIVATLMGLQNDILESENSTMGYDGTQYSVNEWNSDLTLKQAFETSCVWYFRKVIDEVGKDEVQKEINDLEYGNCDISEWNGSNCNPLPELNGFWLESSLKISPKEQIDMLADIFEGNTNYSEEEIEILKNIMNVGEINDVSLYGKTGTGNSVAWFVGFFEKDSEKHYFTVFLENSEQKNLTGKDAKNIAIAIIEQYYY